MKEKYNIIPYNKNMALIYLRHFDLIIEFMLDYTNSTVKEYSVPGKVDTNRYYQRLYSILHNWFWSVTEATALKEFDDELKDYCTYDNGDWNGFWQIVAEAINTKIDIEYEYIDTLEYDDLSEAYETAKRWGKL